MNNRALILGWGGPEASAAIESLKHCAAGVDLVDGGSMAPQLLSHLEPHSRVLLLGSVPLGGKPGEVVRFRGCDLERLHPLAALHEAAVSLELFERQPHEFFVIVTEPGRGAAEALAAAARRQLASWAQPMTRSATAH